jgi:hypothetical protein
MLKISACGSLGSVINRDYSDVDVDVRRVYDIVRPTQEYQEREGSDIDGGGRYHSGILRCFFSYY